jgi:PAS domain S-box-containing protein
VANLTHKDDDPDALRRRIAQLEGECEDLRAAVRSLKQSQTRDRALIEMGAAVYTVLAPDGTITYQSSSVQQAFGYRSDELVGRSVFDVLHADDAEQARRDLADVAAKPLAAATAEYRLAQPDGSLCNVEVTASNLQNIAAVGGILLTTYDVTARKWAEEALRQAKGRFEDFISGSPFGYVEVDGAGAITFANQRAADMAGHSLERMRRMPFREVLAPEEHGRAGSLVRPGGAHGQPGPEEYRILTAGGESRFVEATTLPLLTKTGKQIGLRVTFLDVTERHRAQDALLRSESRFRELADLLPEVVYEMDSRGRLTYVNDCAYQITGYSREDLERGFDAAEIFVPADRERARANIARLLRGEAEGVREYAVLRKDGATFRVLSRASLIVHDGAPVGLRGILFKIDG